MQSMKETEDEVLAFWGKEKIYEKSNKKNSKGKKFYMMDGPPYATGHIHMGTALNKILKDIAMRSKRLQGCSVFDRPGYDTHGVPIEFQVEKEIGSRGKSDIEKFGVQNFVDKCKKFATQYIDVMNSEFKNLGVWMNWEEPYLTLSEEYMESIWAAFKKAEEKDLLYLGKYPVHVCPRCETAVAYNEIEYARQKDNSIYVKFKLKDKKRANTFLIIFTTTPWTLPGNTGIMAHPDAIYQEVEVAEGERWIIARDLVQKIMSTLERGYTVKDEFEGKKLEGLEYESPLAKNIKLKVKNAYRVVLSARYVTTEDGTGLVHCAPGHGKEDYEVGKEYDLDMPSPVANNGLLTEEAGKYAGKKAREVDSEIISDLKESNDLVYIHEYEHDYPLCWRDKSPLLMISQPQWFLKISDIQKKLLKENEKTNWVPNWMQLRMKSWLEGIGDWPVSRQRYWGTPLPIWVNDENQERIVVGSVAELQKLSGIKKFDLHKPGIDSVIIKKDGKTYKRVNAVLDVWFDSGVSSWAALGLMNNSSNMKKYWPADLNIEGRDQVRGWWNSQLILSEIMFDKKPFESILVHGMVLDLSKKKMSKSFGNIISPSDIISKYGRDYLRYYFAKLSKGEDFSYDEKFMEEIQKVFMILSNVNNFVNQLSEKKAKLKVEDKWIMSRFMNLVKNVTEAYNSYRFYDAIEALENFVLNDLSRTYIQIIRDRSDEVSVLLNEIRNGILQLYAPVIPFLTENLWRKLNKENRVKEESIFLSDLQKLDAKKISNELEKSFELALMIIENGLSARDNVKIGLKWPLSKATITLSRVIEKELHEVIMKQLNVKSLKFITSKDKKEDDSNNQIKVELDTQMTEELEAEGYSREFARNVQSVRKKSGLHKGDEIVLKVSTNISLQKMLEKHIDFLKERVNAKEIIFIVGNSSEMKHSFSIKDTKVSIELE